MMKTECQRVLTLIRQLWVYTVCSGLSVRKLRISVVSFLSRYGKKQQTLLFFNLIFFF